MKMTIILDGEEYVSKLEGLMPGTTCKTFAKEFKDLLPRVEAFTLELASGDGALVIGKEAVQRAVFIIHED